MTAEESKSSRSREEAVAIIEAGLGLETQKIATKYVAPLFWGNATSDADLAGNGTVTFLKFEEDVIGLTCDHVVRVCLENLDEDPLIQSQVLDLAIDLPGRIIDRNPALDLATIRFTVEEVAAMDKWAHTPVEGWPPAPPDEGRGVFYSGFPNNRVRKLGPLSWEFGVYTALGVATSVSSDTIIYQYEREYLVDSLGQGLPPANEYLGGMSGGMMWTLVTPENGADYWRPGGMIYEWSTDFELLYARRLDSLLPDGRFKH